MELPDNSTIFSYLLLSLLNLFKLRHFITNDIRIQPFILPIYVSVSS